MSLEWTLDVGGVHLTLIGPTDHVRAFANAWSAWSGNDSGWSVHFVEDETLPAPVGSYFVARPNFKSNICSLNTAGFHGTINLGTRKGELHHHPAANRGDLAYFIRTVFALAAFEQQKLLFHAAGIVHQGRAYALFGRSGSGKTTASRLSTGKPVLSDDLLLLCPNEDRIDVWATPFGHRRHPDVHVAPLHALLRLIQATEDRLTPMPLGETLAALVANSPVVNADTGRMPKLMDIWGRMLNMVPAHRLYFRKAGTFWEVIDADLG